MALFFVLFFVPKQAVNCNVFVLFFVPRSTLSMAVFFVFCSKEQAFNGNVFVLFFFSNEQAVNGNVFLFQGAGFQWQCFLFLKVSLQSQFFLQYTLFKIG